ncbi:MAG: UDP-N-acetylglucosamine 1-carboxyvinyltransferase [Armatimonadetes bacterium]|nr:UDP-N-acetylglucosamine 1-carboxyvinyltransferase [Armatimonadota bacterium]MDW8029231.1 UDP-N-acetylglucosamine 1-carboxyvinyltransferase [Armatimonadota bacterium]
MTTLRVVGGRRLQGFVEVSGSKNAALALLPAALLCRGQVTLYRVPEIIDVQILLDIIKALNVDVIFENETVYLDTKQLAPKPLPNGSVAQIRASIYLAGVLLTQFGEVTIGLPGGCPLSRQVDFHLDAFQKMGAVVSLEGEIIKAFCPKGKLHGAFIELDPRWRSVGTTVNIMLSASLAEGVTVIKNAAMEPEVVTCARYLKAMGAKISGEGTPIVKIEGVKKLSPADWTVIPDRMEAGTYLIAGAITKGKVSVIGVPADWLRPFLQKLIEAGADVEADDDRISVSMDRNPRAITVVTEPYPGFPTDLQPPMGAFLAKCEGVSLIVETIHRDRLLYFEELSKLGARAKIEVADNPKRLPCLAWVEGIHNFQSATVTALDLRAGAALLLASLSADGETIIQNAEKIQRGYAHFVEKLSSLGADVNIVMEEMVSSHVGTKFRY